jgi:hypothetical protein
MPNRPISPDLANAMIADYLAYMTAHKIDMKDQTHCVEFSSDALLAWMGSVSSYCDQYRICMGRYPIGHEYAGRLTVIVWPYKDGKPAVKPKDPKPPGNGGDDDDDEPVDPFNEGTLNP